ncbi:hypothetical protein ACP4OV_003839 [Aristida adscensionis]
MKTHAVVVCATVGTLGFVTVVLGIAGETATAEAFVRSYLNVYGGYRCVYRATPAFGCGIVAALLALTAQVVVTAAAAWCGCCPAVRQVAAAQARRIVGIVLAAVSWILAILVVALFIVGAVENTDHEARTTGDGGCYLAPGNVAFAAATALSLVATALQIASYMLLQATTPPAASTQQQPPPEVVTPQLQQAAATGGQVAGGGDLPPSAPPAALPEARTEP